MDMGKRLTQEEFEKRVEDQGNGEYTPLEDYQGAKTTILMKHESCGYEWKISPDNFFKGKRCPYCSKKPKKMSQEIFEKRVEEQGDREYRSEEHTSELQSRFDIVCRLLLEKKKNK